MAGPFRRADLRFHIFLIHMVAFMHDATCARLEPGKMEFTLATSRNMPVAIHAILKSMFEKTSVKISIAADGVSCSTSFKVGWELRYTRCAQLYTVNSGELLVEELFKDPSLMYSVEPEIIVMRNESQMYSCEEVTSGGIHPQFPPSNVTTCYVPPKSLPKGSKSKVCEEGTVLDLMALYEDNQKGDSQDSQEGGKTGTGEDSNAGGTGENSNAGGTGEDSNAGGTGEDSNAGGNAAERVLEYVRQKRSTYSTPAMKRKRDTEYESPSAGYRNKNVIAHTTVTGSYLLMLNISTDDDKGVSFQVTVDMKGPYGYLSATQYPLLKFYVVMTGLDALLAFIWLFLLYRHYQNLSGIHIWIGVVIFFSLVETVAFYGEFEHMNNLGTESSTGILLAELVSCVRRTLARLLTLIISFGYGFTKNTLGRHTKYVVTFGLLFVTLSMAEAVLRVSESYEHSMIAVLPLSVLEFTLVFWILRGLRRTSMSLRLANEEAKLKRYRLFITTGVLCVVCSVTFSIWSMKTHRFSECVEKYNALWLDDAFWHILFHVILLVIMIVCRPQNRKTMHIKLLKVNVIMSDDKNEVKMRAGSPQKAVKDTGGDS